MVIPDWLVFILAHLREIVILAFTIAGLAALILVIMKIVR